MWLPWHKHETWIALLQSQAHVIIRMIHLRVRVISMATLMSMKHCICIYVEGCTMSRWERFSQLPILVVNKSLKTHQNKIAAMLDIYFYKGEYFVKVFVCYRSNDFQNKLFRKVIPKRWIHPSLCFLPEEVFQFSSKFDFWVDTTKVDGRVKPSVLVKVTHFLGIDCWHCQLWFHRRKVCQYLHKLVIQIPSKKFSVFCCKL